MAKTVFDDIMDGPGRHDPYPVMAGWREEQPVYPVCPGHWLVTRHEDVVGALRDPRLGVLPAPRIQIPVLRTIFRMFKFLDPPDHRRLRQPIVAPYTAKSVERLRPFVASLAAELLEGRESLDVVADFAKPLPIAAACEMLGIPVAKRRKLGRWSIKMLKALDTPVPGGIGDVVRMIRAREVPPLTSLDAATKLRRFGRRQLRGKVKNTVPSPALDALAKAVQDGGMALDDAVATWMVMLVGGVGSIRSFLSGAVYTLLRHPDQLDRLRQDPSLLPQAVEELLRFEGPGVQVARVAQEDAEVGGVRIAKGDMLHLMLGAANRDPDAFADPYRFDICRHAEARQVAFGTGLHYFPGDALTRVLAEEALAVLVPRLPDGLPAGFQPTWRRSMSVREITSLPLALAPAPAHAPHVWSK